MLFILFFFKFLIPECVADIPRYRLGLSMSLAGVRRVASQPKVSHKADPPSLHRHSSRLHHCRCEWRCRLPTCLLGRKCVDLCLWSFKPNMNTNVSKAEFYISKTMCAGWSTVTFVPWGGILGSVHRLSVYCTNPFGMDRTHSVTPGLCMGNLPLFPSLCCEQAKEVLIFASCVAAVEISFLF